VPKQFAHDYLKELTAVIEDGLLRDGSVSIYGFGNFKLQWAAPRMGHNPKTGAAMEIAGRHKVIFRPHKRLREFINRRYRKLSVEVLADSPRQQAPLHRGLPPLGESAGPLARASAAETIAASHTIAERINLSPRQAPPRERPAGGSTVFSAPGHGQAGFGVERGQAVRLPKALWVGVAAGVLALLVAVLVLLYPGSAPIPPPAERVQRADTQVAVGDRSGGGRPAVYTAGQSESSAGQPSAQVTQAAAMAPREAAAPAQTERAVTAPAAPAAGTPGGVHSVQRGDSLWGISAERYRDPFLWPNIYRANLERVSNPDVLRSGTRVTVPPLQGHAQALTAQDYRDVATGYLRAYEAYKRRGNLKAAYYLWVANLRDPQVVQQHASGIDTKDLAFVRALNK